MLNSAAAACCGRCAGADAAARTARRHLYKSAVFPVPADRAGGADARPEARAEARADGLPEVTFGVAVDASPHVLVISGADGERSFAFGPAARVWRGRTIPPNMIRAGDRVVVRSAKGRRGVADKVWAGIGRATGAILERHGDTMLVDEGATRRRQLVVLPSRAATRIQVRFPELTPGHLVDVIGMRRGDALEALIPATALPPTFGPDPLPRRPAPARQGGGYRGAATWHEPAAPGAAEEGLAYPAIDPGAGCAEAAADAAGAGAAGLPYLAVGSLVRVENECTGDSALLPVTTCGAVARLFTDRCLACGTSPRSRIADLTMASFVRLGGELERGCFNATIRIGR